jgi:hypothetical protein
MYRVSRRAYNILGEYNSTNYSGHRIRCCILDAQTAQHRRDARWVWVRMRDFGSLPRDRVNLCNAPLAGVDVFFGETWCCTLAGLPFHQQAIVSAVEFMDFCSATLLAPDAHAYAVIAVLCGAA